MDALIEEVGPSHVFHLGAYTHVGKSWQRVDECVQANVQGTVNLLQSLHGSGYGRFVNMGTSEIYGDVPSPFAERRCVRYLHMPPASTPRVLLQGVPRRQGIADRDAAPIQRLRTGAECRPRDPRDHGAGLRRQQLLMTEGRQTREFNYVEDLVDGIVRAATVSGIEGQLFNLGCGQDVSIREVATLVLELLGNPVQARFGALPDRPTEIREMRSDSARARELLGWKPRHSLRDGLEKTIEWYRKELSDPDSPFAI